MFLVVGLGNPGREYEGNRHNVGFVVVDALREKLGLPDFKAKFGGGWTRGDLTGTPVVLLKPLTYMNLSGDCVQPAAAFFKVPPSNLIVVHDELDLAWKDVRLKAGGGHAGNNGLRSIIERLGQADFVRVRVGIGKPPPGFRGDGADWVLSNFNAVERAELPNVVDTSIAAIESVVRDGIAAAMTRVNTRATGKS
ncbi:MAG TPA: aminoacyl-tRNA hydrolase [Polyangiaceae bacterium]|nr:aminoacyl-tRNA hydrolase [Polyangiaceae bacterium]